MADEARARSEVVRLAETLASRQILSRSLHGNISVRLPGTDHILMTGSSLAVLTEEELAVVDLDDNVVQGEVGPTEMEIIRMHTGVYREHADVGCIVHTHSPFATAFAVAGQPLPLVAESLARWGVTRPIPLAKWAPRGSDDSVGNILAALRGHEDAAAVLLENHGLLSWGATANEALRRTIAIEENAELAVLAQSLGGPRSLSPEMARLAAGRRDTFERQAAGGTS